MSATSFFINSKRSFKVICVSLVFAIIFSVSVMASGPVVVYKINYEGKQIAVVGDKKEFLKAVDIVKKKVKGCNVQANVSEPEYIVKLSINPSYDSSEKIAEAILDNTNGISKAAYITVDGVRKACLEEDKVNEMISKRLAAFGNGSDSQFVENVAVEKEYVLTSSLDDVKIAQDVVDRLCVRTQSTVVTNKNIKYKTVKKGDNTKLIGSNEVETEGKFGIRRITESVVMINGKETQRSTVSDEVIEEPVDKVVLIGTARTLASAKQKAAAKKAGFIYPLPKNVREVSAYYGDGRNHKGVDLRAPNGTPIYASAGGVVTLSGYNGGYGNCVIIDHLNGLKTLYGHASELLVKAGDRVSAGDLIAYVGRTGNATGNHLHFEVIVKGKNVDPAPFLNLD